MIGESYMHLHCLDRINQTLKTWGGIMNKHLNLLYFSATDTTAQVVKTVADGMNGSVKENNITLPNHRNRDITFGEDDLVIIGVPVYGGRVPAFLIDYFTRVKGNNTVAVFIVVYGNRNYDDALLELRDAFERNGFIGVAGGAFIGEHSFTNKVGTGRPDQRDLEIARRFGTEIKEKLSMIKDKDLFNLPELFVKGNYPYKERKSMPIMLETNVRCTNCGLCAEHCPMGAIDFNNYSNIDAAKCIRCCSCIKKCPEDAKSMSHELQKKTTQFLIDNFSTVRNEPEVYII
jgi:ferredoxin